MEFNPGATFHAHVAQVLNSAKEYGGGELGRQLALNEWVGHAREANYSNEFNQLVVQAVEQGG